jgi:hypothetical protein
MVKSTVEKGHSLMFMFTPNPTDLADCSKPSNKILVFTEYSRYFKISSFWQNTRGPQQ